MLAQTLFNNFVVGNGDSLLVELGISSLVNQVSDGLSGGISIVVLGYIIR